MITIRHIPMASVYWVSGKECHGSIPSTWRFLLQATEVYSPSLIYPLCAQTATAAQVQVCLLWLIYGRNVWEGPGLSLNLRESIHCLHFYHASLNVWCKWYKLSNKINKIRIANGHLTLQNLHINKCIQSSEFRVQRFRNVLESRPSVGSAK